MSQTVLSRHEVHFPYTHGTLTGVLITPPYVGRHPAVVLLPGSGPADRDTPYLRPVRDHLVREGIAVLVFDKPGLGGSTGDWRHQTFYDRVEQARAAMLFLQGRADIDAHQVGLYGISQGAWITLLAAATDPAIPFIIPVSGPAMRPIDQDVYYVEHVMHADGFSEVDIQQAVQYVQRVLLAAREDAEYQDVATRLVDGVQQEPWYHYYPIPDADMWEYFRRNAQLDYDPAGWLAQVRCPVLAIFGAADLLLPVETSVAVYQQALKKAGNQDVTIKVFAEAGHLITVPPAEKLAPGFLELIAAWLQQRTTNG
jgi:uncharacterized protein